MLIVKYSSDPSFHMLWVETVRVQYFQIMDARGVEGGGG